ncbi:MAG: hypothetical protein IKA02_00430 [Clostridia bacterium]|nr:hypothetical protein [Clostridia bacterium]
MEYTHKKQHGIFRLIYIALLVIGFVLYPMGNGTSLKLMFTIASIVALVGGVYLLIKCEMITYTYFIKERKSDFDFFVNRAVGRRGNYVCYYYISDAIKVIKHTKEAVSEISKKYQGTGYYSFCHGLFSKDQYIILFKLDGKYDMIVVEMNEEFKTYFENCVKKAIPVSSNNDDEDDDVEETQKVSDTTNDE